MSAQPRPAPKDWGSLKRRARAQRSTIARTHPDDGPERFVLRCGDWCEMYHHLEHLVSHLEEEEARQREADSQPSLVHRPLTAEEHMRHKQEAYLGALSSAIRTLERMLSGKQAISRVTLTMAQSEGRDYLKELQERLSARVLERFELSRDLAANGKRPRRHAEYQQAALDLGKVGDR